MQVSVILLKRYFLTSLPSGYLFYWQRKRHSTTGNLTLDFTEERSI